MTRKSKLWVDKSGTTWWEVTQEGVDPVGLQGPGPCRGLQYVPRQEFDSNFTPASDPLFPDLPQDDTGLILLASTRAAYLLGLDRTYISSMGAVSNGSTHLQILKVYLLLHDILGSEGDVISRWMRSYNTYLCGIPLDLVKTNNGRDDLITYLSVMARKEPLQRLCYAQANKENAWVTDVVSLYKPSKRTKPVGSK